MAVDVSQIRDSADKINIEVQARGRFIDAESDAGASYTQWRRYMRLYDPDEGDQWPEDADERPDKIHMTVNVVKPAVDVASRIQSITPRISLSAIDNRDQTSRAVAEAIEKMFYSWLHETDWDVWLNDACRTKSIGGRTFLKPFWNAEDKRPDVSVIEQPHRLRVGWRGNDYKRMDWAIFEYEISPLEAKTRWPRINILPAKGDGPHTIEVSDHSDPLDTIPNYGFTGLSTGGAINTPEDRGTTEYNSRYVKVWDYWYKRLSKDGKVEVCNAMLVEGRLVQGPDVHSEYKDIPFILIENDHRPGSPNGISDIKALIDIQDGFNRALSALTQIVVDDSDPAWQKTGENATSVEPGDVPRAGEVVAPGPGNRLDRVDTGVNTFPVGQLVDEYWNSFHKITGLTEALFGALPGNQTSGRALAVQIEAAANRLGPRRDRLYRALRELFKFWQFMLEANNATVPLPATDEEGAPTGETEDLKLSPLFKRVGVWKIIPPEITPRDVIEHTTNVINKIQARLMSLKRGQDETGIESPEDEIRDIIEELNNADLNPGHVQTKVAVMQLLQTLEAQEQQQQAMQKAAAAANQQTNEEMAANPTLDEEAGGEMAGLPMSQQGAAGGVPTQQTLIRADQDTGQAENLQQIAIRP